MSSVGTDIKEVFTELAEAISIYDHVSGEIIASGEYTDFEREWLPRSAFESEFVITNTFAYDTVAKPGDRIDFHTTDGRYLIATLVSNTFEREVISKDGILYKCNKQAMVMRKSETETRDTNYELSYDWDEVFSGEYVLFTGRLSDQEIINDERYLRAYTRKRLLFASRQLDIQSKDRLHIDDEMYQIELVEQDRLPGLNMCTLIDYQGES
jgi:hypothetical protein